MSFDVDLSQMAFLIFIGLNFQVLLITETRAQAHFSGSQPVYITCEVMDKKLNNLLNGQSVEIDHLK